MKTLDFQFRPGERVLATLADGGVLICIVRGSWTDAAGQAICAVSPVDAADEVITFRSGLQPVRDFPVRGRAGVSPRWGKA